MVQTTRHKLATWSLITDSTPGPCTPDFSEFNRAPPQMTQSCSHHCAQLLLGEGQYHIPDMQ